MFVAFVLLKRSPYYYISGSDETDNNKDEDNDNNCESRKSSIVMSIMCALDNQQPLNMDLDQKFNF